jgi:hypothetical protein
MLPVDDEKHPVCNILPFHGPLLDVKHYTESLLYRWVRHVYQIVQGLIHSLFLVLPNCPILWYALELIYGD